jgi:microcystin-dependent protein
MSNETSAPMVLEELALLVKRLDAIDRQPGAWTRGMITLWYGVLSDIPTGWWPCDGTAAPDGVTTPDLRGRFPVGLKSSEAGFDTLGETGGAASANLQHTHTGPSHNHTIDHDHPSFDSGAPDNTASITSGGGSAASGDHQHPVNVPSFAAAGAPIPESSLSGTGNTGTGGSTTQSILPPYTVAGHYIYRYV